MAVYCEKCGQQNNDSAKFCRSCGGEVIATTQGGTLIPGVTLDKRYEIKRLIKSGGMGAVYEASDHRFKDARCAVKEMLNISNEPDQQKYYAERFMEEGQLLYNLRHPNFPVVKDYFVEASRYYLVMDYIDEKDLETIMTGYDGNMVPEELVIEWSVHILDALDYLHNLSPPIVYRDLKPGNIMVRSEDKKIILVDFGIARIVRPGSDTTKTGIGTPAFSPIELLRGKPEPRSDIYSLGATMHCLLTGVVPQPMDFRPVREHNPHISVFLESIVMRALEMEAKNRYESAKDMKYAIENRIAPIEKTRIVKIPDKYIPHEPLNKTVKAFLPETVSLSEEDNRSMATEKVHHIIPHEPLNKTVKVLLPETVSLSEDNGSMATEKVHHVISPVHSDGIDKPESNIIRKNKLLIPSLAVISVFLIILLVFAGKYYSSPDYCLKKAVEILEIGDKKLSKHYYDKVKSRLTKENVKDIISLAEVSIEKDPDNTMEYIKKVYSLDKSNKEVKNLYNKEGTFLIDGMDYTGAIRCFNELLVIDGKNIPALNGLSKCYIAVDDYDKVIEINKKINILSPCVETYINIGKSYVNKKDYKNGLTFLKEAQKYKPEGDEKHLINSLLISCYLNIGKKYSHEEMFAEAKNNFKNVLAIDKVNNEAKNELGKCYFKEGENFLSNGDNEQARESFLNVIALMPGSDMGKKANEHIKEIDNLRVVETVNTPVSNGGYDNYNYSEPTGYYPPSSGSTNNDSSNSSGSTSNYTITE